MDSVDVYWKDLKVGIRRKLIAWYNKHNFEGLEPLYNNEAPFISITKDLYESETEDDMTLFDGMVI